jgi:hypothetical protein
MRGGDRRGAAAALGDLERIGPERMAHDGAEGEHVRVAVQHHGPVDAAQRLEHTRCEIEHRLLPEQVVQSPARATTSAPDPGNDMAT